MNDANGSGGSAVVIASRDAKDVMRKLEDCAVECEMEYV